MVQWGGMPAQTGVPVGDIFDKVIIIVGDDVRLMYLWWRCIAF